MHAVVVREAGDRDAIEGGAEHVKANVVPAVQQLHGVVTAIWMTDGSGATLNVLVFEDEAVARVASEGARNAPRPGYLQVLSVDVYRVLAHF